MAGYLRACFLIVFLCGESRDLDDSISILACGAIDVGFSNSGEDYMVRIFI